MINGSMALRSTMRTLRLPNASCVLRWACVLFCVFALKRFYSQADANDLRWILYPTTLLVELWSGEQFSFESHAGYLNQDRSFLIAPACAGVNFLITSFVLLCVMWLRKTGSLKAQWLCIPAAAVAAYMASIVANSVRIALALKLAANHVSVGALDVSRIHRLEGIIVYFGFLLLVFAASEKAFIRREKLQGWRLWIPLIVYEAMALGLPLANAAFRNEHFVEHALFVILVPPVMLFALLLPAIGRSSLPDSHGEHRN